MTRVRRGYRQAKAAAIPMTRVGRGYEQAKVAAVPMTRVRRGYEQAKVAAVPMARVGRGYEQAKAAAVPMTRVGRGYEQAKAAAVPMARVRRGYRQAKAAAIPTLSTATAVRGTHDRKQRTLEPPVLTPCTVGCYVPLRAKGSGSVPAVVMCASRSGPCTRTPAVCLTQRPLCQPSYSPHFTTTRTNVQRPLLLLFFCQILRKWIANRQGLW